MKATANELFAKTNKWIEQNPDMWESFQYRAKKAAREQNHWSARGIAEALRWDGRYRKVYGEEYKIPNEITPVLGRYVVALYPETEYWFLRSKSKVDESDIDGALHDVVA